jgi:hypothetical protein
MDEWHTPGETPPAPDDPGWIEPERDPQPPPWPEAPGSRDSVPPAWIMGYFGGAVLVCVAAGLVVMAGISLRSQSWLGWAVLIGGLLLFLPAAALGTRALTLILVALSQVGNRRSGR